MNNTCTDKKICCFCGEDIPAALMRCPYCGNVLKKEEGELNNEEGELTTDSINTDQPLENAEYKENGESIADHSSVVMNSNVSVEDAASCLLQEAGTAGQQIIPDNISDNISGNISDSISDIASGSVSDSMSDSASDNSYNPYTGSVCPSDPSEGYLLGATGRRPLRNGIKVFLTTLCTIIPCLGQLIGVIAAIVFLNSDDSDRRSFGAALLVSSLVVFVISISASFMFVLALAVLLGGYR